MNIKFFFLLFLFPLYTFSQKNTNRFKNKERQGVWIVYQDSTKKQIDNIGRYRKGIPRGKWKYYDTKNNLLKTERIVFRRLYTKFYFPNGKLQKKGKAKIVITEKLWHYYYFGKWKTYNNKGELTKLMYYNQGNLVSEKKMLTSEDAGLNAVLAEKIRGLNKQLYKYSDSLKASETSFGKNSIQYTRLLQLSNFNSLVVIDSLDKIISHYGYPGKTLVGSDYALVFSIISSANISIRQKYYDVIINAADKGELEWTDVAFFVDKVKVAKKEKQVYGTQFRFDMSKQKMFYYPIENKSSVNERRKKVGLDDINMAEADDTLNY